MTDDNTPATKDYAFEGHACLTGDCPHDTQAQCLNAAFDAGRSEADELIAAQARTQERCDNVAACSSCLRLSANFTSTNGKIVCHECAKEDPIIYVLESALKIHAEVGRETPASMALTILKAYREKQK